MTEEQLGRLFEAFSQAEASTRASTAGRPRAGDQPPLLRLMGGDLTVESVHGQGSTFGAAAGRPAILTGAAEHVGPISPPSNGESGDE